MPTASNTRIGCCGNAPAREAQEVWPEEREAQRRTDRALGARAWSPRAGGRKGSEVSSGRKRLTKREHARRNALPEHLPRREEIIAVEGEERLCVCCGEERCRIGFEE